jgi:hypothetical protein
VNIFRPGQSLLRTGNKREFDKLSDAKFREKNIP